MTLTKVTHTSNKIQHKPQIILTSCVSNSLDLDKAHTLAGLIWVLIVCKYNSFTPNYRDFKWVKQLVHILSSLIWDATVLKGIQQMALSSKDYMSHCQNSSKFLSVFISCENCWCDHVVFFFTQYYWPYLIRLADKTEKDWCVNIFLLDYNPIFLHFCPSHGKNWTFDMNY